MLRKIDLLWMGCILCEKKKTVYTIEDDKIEDEKKWERDDECTMDYIELFKWMYLYRGRFIIYDLSRGFSWYVTSSFWSP